VSAGVLRRLAGSSVVHMLVAFMAMGSWAFWANRLYPLPQPVFAGLVQGMLSAALTLCLKLAVDGLRARFSGVLRYGAPPLLALLGSAALLVGVHWLSSTPEILKTIAVPLLVSGSYVAVYNAAMVGKGTATAGQGEG
jgi:xanthosine utilization system XapX-like protein